MKQYQLKIVLAFEAGDDPGAREMALGTLDDLGLKEGEGEVHRVQLIRLTPYGPAKGIKMPDHGWGEHD